MKTVFTLILSVLWMQVGLSQESATAMEKEKVKGKLSVSMLRELKSSLKTNYGKDLDSLKILSIYYYQPKANCPNSDVYKFIKPEKEEPKDKKYLKSDLLYLCFEKNVVSKYVKNDIAASVYNAFFSENRGCEGSVTVTSDGNYLLVKDPCFRFHTQQIHRGTASKTVISRFGCNISRSSSTNHKKLLPR